MIEIRNLTKLYDTKKAVDQISFTVNQGEIFGFLGPNGAGKTTTIRMLIGLLKPTEGQIYIDKLDVISQTKQVHERIGVVFELPNLYNRTTIYNNLKFFGDLYGISHSRLQEVMESLHLHDKRDAKVDSLSKGWKQRVLIARALLHRPKVLFLDEPTSGLDPNTTSLIRSYLKGLKEQGTTVVITTHDMLEADELSDRVGIMHKGKIVALDTPAQLKRRYGREEIQLVYKEKGESVTLDMPMNERRSAELLFEKLVNGDVISIHSKEASLADVFAKLTGSELS